MNLEDQKLISQATVQQCRDDWCDITWKFEAGETPVSIYAGDSPQNIDASAPLIQMTAGNRARISGLDHKKRYYFEVRPAGGCGVITALRQVLLDQTFNFRDLGGYETRDGRRVKWGQVFRSDALSRINEEGREFLVRMGLKLVCDFRTGPEIAKAPDLLPEDGSIQYLNLPVSSGEQNFVNALEKIKKGDASWLTPDYMINGYLNNIDKFAGQWAAALQRLADPVSRPFLFHCTGGKDRAGTFAALLLLVLGVPEETVIFDHQLSNVYIADLLVKIYKQVEGYGLDPKRVESYFTAPRECILALLDHLRNKYGTAERYLLREAGIGYEMIGRLRDQLLEE